MNIREMLVEKKSDKDPLESIEELIMQPNQEMIQKDQIADQQTNDEFESASEINDN